MWGLGGEEAKPVAGALGWSRGGVLGWGGKRPSRERGLGAEQWAGPQSGHQGLQKINQALRVLSTPYFFHLSPRTPTEWAPMPSLLYAFIQQLLRTLRSQVSFSPTCNSCFVGCLSRAQRAPDHETAPWHRRVVCSQRPGTTGLFSSQGSPAIHASQCHQSSKLL